MSTNLIDDRMSTNLIEDKMSTNLIEGKMSTNLIGDRMSTNQNEVGVEDKLTNIIFHLPSIKEKEILVLKLQNAGDEDMQNQTIEDAFTPNESMCLTLENSESNSENITSINVNGQQFSTNVDNEGKDGQVAIQSPPLVKVPRMLAKGSFSKGIRMNRKNGPSCFVTREKTSKVPHVQILTEPTRHATIKHFGDDSLLGEGFGCDICEDLMPSSGTLRHHLVVAHDFQVNLSHYCNLCERECWSPKQLKYHLLIHHSVRDASLACSVCGTQLSTAAECRAHQQKHPLTYLCPVCPFKCAAKHQLSLHVQEHMSILKAHLCSYCGKRFKSSDARDTHLWRHKRQLCNRNGSCKVMLDDESWFLIHLQNRHKLKLKEVRDLVSERDKVDSLLDKILDFRSVSNTSYNRSNDSYDHSNACVKTLQENIFIEIEVSNEFENKRILKLSSKEILKEIKNYVEKLQKTLPKNTGRETEKESLLEQVLDCRPARHRCGLCNVYLDTSEDLASHKYLHTKSFSCESCDRVFPSLKLLRMHLMVHKNTKQSNDDSRENERPPKSGFVCAECGKHCLSQVLLERHYLGHKKRAKYECKICRCKLKNKYRLNEHLTKTHKIFNEKYTYLCTVCDRKFISKKFLEIHKRKHILHNGRDKFKCEKCNLTFVKKGSFEKHLANHDKPHCCPTCNLECKSKAQLYLHLNTHNPGLNNGFQCFICNLKFDYKCRLDSHVRTHTNSRPYICELCGKGFRRLYQCNLHKKSVHEKFKLNCQFCNKPFAKKDNLLRHQLVSHHNLHRFICGFCAHTFPYSHNLRKHLITKHDRQFAAIDHLTKKSFHQIYVIPELGSEEIAETAKRSVESAVANEQIKVQQILESNESSKMEMANSCNEISDDVDQAILNDEATDKFVTEDKQLIIDTLESENRCSFCYKEMSDQVFKCFVCLKLFCTELHLKSHSSEFHKVLYQCQVCSMNFVSQQDCANHIAMAHAYPVVSNSTTVLHQVTVEDNQSLTNSCTSSDPQQVMLPQYSLPVLPQYSLLNTSNPMLMNTSSPMYLNASNPMLLNASNPMLMVSPPMLNLLQPGQSNVILASNQNKAPLLSSSFEVMSIDQSKNEVLSIPTSSSNEDNIFISGNIEIKEADRKEILISNHIVSSELNDSDLNKSTHCLNTHSVSTPYEEIIFDVTGYEQTNQFPQPCVLTHIGNRCMIEEENISNNESAQMSCQQLVESCINSNKVNVNTNSELVNQSQLFYNSPQVLDQNSPHSHFAIPHSIADGSKSNIVEPNNGGHSVATVLLALAGGTEDSISALHKKFDEDTALPNISSEGTILEKENGCVTFSLSSNSLRNQNVKSTCMVTNQEYVSNDTINANTNDIKNSTLEIDKSSIVLKSFSNEVIPKANPMLFSIDCEENQNNLSIMLEQNPNVSVCLSSNMNPTLNTISKISFNMENETQQSQDLSVGFHYINVESSNVPCLQNTKQDSASTSFLDFHPNNLSEVTPQSNAVENTSPVQSIDDSAQFADASLTTSAEHNSSEVSTCQISKNLGKKNSAITNEDKSTIVEVYMVHCHECKKMFPSVQQLRRHLKTHAERKHVCRVCGKSFTESFNLKTHMLSHSKDRPHSCPICSKCFRYPRDLNDHVRSHSGEKSFVCIDCGTGFFRNRDLLRHIREQHQAKKFKCDICGAMFKRRHYLQTTHMKMHRLKEKNELPFACKQCGKEFATLRQLDEHAREKKHVSTYTCRLCEQEFDRPRQLTRHLKMHEKKL